MPSSHRPYNPFHCTLCYPAPTSSMSSSSSYILSGRDPPLFSPQTRSLLPTALAICPPTQIFLFLLGIKTDAAAAGLLRTGAGLGLALFCRSAASFARLDGSFNGAGVAVCAAKGNSSSPSSIFVWRPARPNSTLSSSSSRLRFSCPAVDVVADCELVLGDLTAAPVSVRSLSSFLACSALEAASSVLLATVGAPFLR